MCIKEEKELKKKYVESKFDQHSLLYYRLIGKGDQDHFLVKNDEVVYIRCSNGEEYELNEYGLFKIIAKPVKIIWIKKVPTEIKIGVPRGATGINIGFHARLRLYPTNWVHLLDLVDEKDSKESYIRIDDVKDVVRECALTAFKYVMDPDSNKIDDIMKFRKEFNIKLNEALMATKLQGFTAVLSHIGFSFDCKILESR